jgi:hypothetical protein
VGYEVLSPWALEESDSCLGLYIFREERPSRAVKNTSLLGCSGGPRQTLPRSLRFLRMILRFLPRTAVRIPFFF